MTTLFVIACKGPRGELHFLYKQGFWWLCEALRHAKTFATKEEAVKLIRRKPAVLGKFVRLGFVTVVLSFDTTVNSEWRTMPNESTKLTRVWPLSPLEELATAAE